MSNLKMFETEFAGRKLIVKTGELALQTNGSCLVQYGDTAVLATAVMSPESRDGIDYFPLMVEYAEKMYAAGKIKGSRFIKRENRPSDEAILTGRMIDRGLRPLFDQAMRRDVQVILTVLAHDGENDPDIPAMIASSIALDISNIPFNGPLAGIRIGRINNEWVINPTMLARTKSELNLVFSATKDRVMMIDADANDLNEEIIYEAFEFGLKHSRKIVEFIEQIKREIGKEKAAIPANDICPEDLDDNQKESAVEIKKVQDEIKTFILEKLDKFLFNIPRGSKNERKHLLHELKDLAENYLLDKQIGKDKRKKIMEFFDSFIEEQITLAIIKNEKRVDGRKLNQIRPLSSFVGLLPRVHGSGLFNRGETQVLSIVTLGAPGDVQTVETMEPEYKKRYMHHYNFPPFSTGEAYPLKGTGRREIGHGALAEKALEPMLPSKEDFPYTIRVVSEVLGSNGSSSMGSTCGSTLALLDAGVPLKKPVGGIAMGLASTKDEEYKILTDLQDLEDGDGGMDFKITGTRDGLTAIQMDTKTAGLTLEIIKKTLAQGREALNQVLDVLQQTISEPRKELSPFAPRIKTIKIHPDKIRELIGPGGKVINKIIADTGVSIDIEEDGSVFVTSNNADGMTKALAIIESIIQEAELGKTYLGQVVKLFDFGAVVEIFPGTEGLVHISEITDRERVMDINKYLKEGQEVKVKVIKIDPDTGKIGLSIKKA
ncbi:MAG: polyribonucleotide nucleotidyltransferase [Patescibacteria group bacterium]